MSNNAAKKYDSADFQESHFGIRNREDLVHIFNVLRNKMYANKILAVLREYSTNACDAHIESNQRDRPIEVTLPTNTNRVLSIRDFGFGLSEDDIRNVYTMYGASTKRGSSELNGQLGFGSKAAFSYVDNFTIVSYHEGFETIYEAYVDETGLGAISQVSKEPSNKHSGIEIRISVLPNDIGNFKTTAINLYKYFETIPKVANLNGSKIEKCNYKLKTTKWGVRDQQNYSYGGFDITAIMGNIAYPLNKQVLADSLRHSPNWRKYEQLLNCPIDFFIPVGELSIAASREALEYDKKSLRTFQTYFDTTITEIIAEFTTRLSKADDIVEAKKCYKMIMHGELHSLSGIIRAGNSLVWNGQPITDYTFTIPTISHVEGENNVPSFTVREITPANIAAGIRTVFLNHGREFEINNETKVFYQNIDDKPILRVRKFLQDNPTVKKVLLFRSETAQCTIDQIVTSCTVPRKYFVDLSTQEPLAVENNRTAAVHNIKHSRKVFQMAEPGAVIGYADSGHWNTTTLEDEEEYYYVYLNRFCPRLNIDTYDISNRTFREILINYEALTGINLTPRVIGIKLVAADRVLPTWRRLDDVIREGLNNEVQNAINSIENIALRQARHEYNILYWLEEGNFQNYLSTLDPSSPMRRMFTKYRTAVLAASNNNVDNYVTIKNIIRQLGIVLPLLDSALATANTNVSNEMKEILDRYPLLNFIHIGYGDRADADLSSNIATYIRCIDKELKELETKADKNK
jgi:hypothetical protein